MDPLNRFWELKNNLPRHIPLLERGLSPETSFLDKPTAGFFLWIWNLTRKSKSGTMSDNPLEVNSGAWIKKPPGGYPTWTRNRHQKSHFSPTTKDVFIFPEQDFADQDFIFALSQCQSSFPKTQNFDPNKKTPGVLSRSSRSFLPKMNSLPLSEVVLKIRSWEYKGLYSQKYYKCTLGL